MEQAVQGHVLKKATKQSVREINPHVCATRASPMSPTLEADFTYTNSFVPPPPPHLSSLGWPLSNTLLALGTSYIHQQCTKRSRIRGFERPPVTPPHLPCSLGWGGGARPAMNWVNPPFEKPLAMSNAVNCGRASAFAKGAQNERTSQEDQCHVRIANGECSSMLLWQWRLNH